MAKIARIENRFLFYCPGCKCDHEVRVAQGNKMESQPFWAWNGSVDAPTFVPSVRVRTNDKNGDSICHFFIVNGHFQFLPDCTHELRSKQIDMEEYR